MPPFPPDFPTESAEPGSETLRRWRLVLGGESDGTQYALSKQDMAIDTALGSLYGNGSGGMGDSAPEVARWLGDIRTYFPSSVVKMLQQDAIERLNLHQLLLEPELLQAVEPDVHLVATLLVLNEAMPTNTRDTARQVVRRVVEQLEKRLAAPMRSAIQGRLSRAVRTRRPRLKEMDWGRTIRANLKHYQPRYETIIPETRHGHGHRAHSLRDVILCIDQSGSMATSVVYASIFGAVLASLPALKTQLIVFDTSVVDLTTELNDPVDLLFGTQLGGGTDINRALAYCQGLVKRPSDTILVLISDLFEGGNAQEMVKRAAHLVGSGVQMIALLALNDEGTPSYNEEVAAAFSGMGIPAFACTPDVFPDLMGAALAREDLQAWAGAHNLTLR